MVGRYIGTHEGKAKMVFSETFLAPHLEHLARWTGSEDIPFLGEIFAPFYNSDAYFKTRKTWEKF